MSAEAALTQVDQPVGQKHRPLRTGWPACAAVQLTKTCKLVNLSERRFGAHINAICVCEYRLQKQIARDFIAIWRIDKDAGVDWIHNVPVDGT